MEPERFARTSRQQSGVGDDAVVRRLPAAQRDHSVRRSRPSRLPSAGRGQQIGQSLFTPIIIAYCLLLLFAFHYVRVCILCCML